MKKFSKEHKASSISFKLTKWEWLFIVSCFLFYFIWSITQELNYGPDEIMRFKVPLYIYEHGRIPLGSDPAVIAAPYGSSYAFYPSQLGALLSALFMKFTSFFSTEEFHLLVAARFTSVLAAIITVYMTIAIAKELLSRRVRWIMIIMVAFLPQFIFLSSYVNNDMLAVASSALILYAWVIGLKYGWSWKCCTLLAVGLVICALSYENAYGWGLCSMILFASSYLFHKEKNYQQMIIFGGYIIVFVLLLAGPFFLRNALLYDGDILGSASFLKAAEAVGSESIKAVNNPSVHSLGISFFTFLFTDMGGVKEAGLPWLVTSFESFIALFGFMNVESAIIVYIWYGLLFLAGGIGFLSQIPAYFKLWKRKKDRTRDMFCLCMLLCIIIPIGLSMYYSYFVDYQPQGRYCFPALLPIMYFLTIGFDCLLERISSVKYQKLIVKIICGSIIIISIYEYLFVFLPS